MKVRVCVAVDAEAHWGACGGNGMSDVECRSIALDGTLVSPDAVYYLEAEVPLPVETTIQAEVKEG